MKEEREREDRIDLYMPMEMKLVTLSFLCGTVL